MTTTEKKDNRGTCENCKGKGKRLQGGLCKSCRTEGQPAKAPRAGGKLLQLDASEERIDAAGMKVGGFTYPFDPSKTVHTLTFPPGVSKWKAITPATYSLPKGAEIVVRKSYELVIDGQPVRNLGALVEAGSVKVELHEDQRLTPAKRRASEEKAPEAAAVQA